MTFAELASDWLSECARTRRPKTLENYRGTTVKMDLSEKVRLEIGVSDHFVKPTVEAILAAGRTGEVGDGKIFVLPVETVYRIRTGEKDQAAVTPVEEAAPVS